MEMTTRQKLRREFNRFLLRRLPPCKEIAMLISQSLDRRLGLRERLVLRLHLVACRPCERYLQQSEFLSSAINVMNDDEKEALYEGALSASARERIKSALRSAAPLAAFTCLFLG